MERRDEGWTLKREERRRKEGRKKSKVKSKNMPSESFLAALIRYSVGFITSQDCSGESLDRSQLLAVPIQKDLVLWMFKTLQ